MIPDDEGHVDIFGEYDDYDDSPDMLEQKLQSEREFRRQLGIAAKKTRFSPMMVSFGQDRRHRLNSDRRHKDY